MSISATLSRRVERMAALSVLAVGVGTLRASMPVSRQIMHRSLCAAENLVSIFRPVDAPKSTATSVNDTYSTVCLLGRAPESSRRFLRLLSKALTLKKRIPVFCRNDSLVRSHRVFRYDWEIANFWMICDSEVRFVLRTACR